MAGLTTRPYHLCFETLANELRLKIIENLKEGPLSVEELSKRVGAERSTVSHSLQMLRECSYVDVQRAGKQRVYSLRNGAFEAVEQIQGTKNIFHVIDDHIECFCNCECKKIRAKV
ncbi:MAG: winged helix-turn-helix transcriptional regulator [Candidatus Diapherotrites archaeon]|nr:winged helix-turn-helix transcriptional regulator [Candidatus Diapherotrites archaeon]